MHKNDIQMQCFCNVLILNSLLEQANSHTSFSLAKLALFAEASGNLSLPLVSKPERTRATSHPCERGAGLLEI